MIARLCAVATAAERGANCRPAPGDVKEPPERDRAEREIAWIEAEADSED
jgi:hypothetical protein